MVAAGPDRVRRIDAAIGHLNPPRHLVTPLPATTAEWDAVVRWATLSGSGVVLEVGERFGADARDRVERADHLAWALTSPLELPVTDLPRRAWTEVPVAPTVATDAEWGEAFAGGAPAGVSGYRLTADQLRQVGRAARATGGDLSQAVRRLAAGHIDATATRIRPTRGWDDLILDDDRMERVREITMRCRRRDIVFGAWGLSPHPSRGVVALFAGPSGTGKTLAAEVIAGELGLDLLHVDLSSIVSKYVGETEKNLEAVFERPRRQTSCCSSTRPTRSSAGARRSRDATTATPTSRSPTSSSGSSATTAWSSSLRTWPTTSTPHSPAGSTSPSSSRSRRRLSVGDLGTVLPARMPDGRDRPRRLAGQLRSPAGRSAMRRSLPRSLLPTPARR